MSDTEQFEFNLWDIAPDRWATPENRGEYQLVDARIIDDEPGNEVLAFEIERSEKEDNRDA